MGRGVAGTQRSGAQFRESRQVAQWQGHAFERLCRKHASAIAEHLQFAGIAYKAGEWFKRDRGGARAQVDLLFVRGDRVLTFCEMKYVERLSPSALRASLDHKVTALRQAFPDSGIQRVLLLGRDSAGRETVARDVDRVLAAEDVFM